MCHSSFIFDPHPSRIVIYTVPFMWIWLLPPLAERPDIDFRTFVSVVNRQLKPLSLELAQARMEDSPALWCGIVNRSPDAAAQISSKFTAAELELFNKVVSGQWQLLLTHHCPSCYARFLCSG